MATNSVAIDRQIENLKKKKREFNAFCQNENLTPSKTNNISSSISLDYQVTLSGRSTNPKLLAEFLIGNKPSSAADMMAEYSGDGERSTFDKEKLSTTTTKKSDSMSELLGKQGDDEFSMNKERIEDEKNREFNEFLARRRQTKLKFDQKIKIWKFKLAGLVIVSLLLITLGVSLILGFKFNNDTTSKLTTAIISMTTMKRPSEKGPVIPGGEISTDAHSDSDSTTSYHLYFYFIGGGLIVLGVLVVWPLVTVYIYYRPEQLEVAMQFDTIVRHSYDGEVRVEHKMIEKGRAKIVVETSDGETKLVHTESAKTPFTKDTVEQTTAECMETGINPGLDKEEKKANVEGAPH